MNMIDEIFSELKKAKEKFPYWPDDKIHAAAIVNEESGELIRAALQFQYEGGFIKQLIYGHKQANT